MTIHAYLSASSSHRWLHCTKAPYLESSLPDNDSTYAKEGTLAHEIAEMMLKGRWHTQPSIVEQECFYPGMPKEVDAYVKYCQERFNELKEADPLSLMEVEERLDFSYYVPGGFGTGDCVLVGDKTLEIIDLKFGKGVPVEPKDNPQLMLYGLGALMAYDFIHEIAQVRLTIAQVRLDGIKSWSISKEDIIKWGKDYVKPRAELAYHGKGEIAPGEWCKFCKFKYKCKERAKANLLIVKAYKDIEAASLSPLQVSKILSQESEIKSWLKDITDYALQQALGGIDYPGFKVVEGRSNRKIMDQEAVAKILINNNYKDIYKPVELKTLTELEKMVGKKNFEALAGEFIIKPQGKPTLVPDSDKRQAINSVDELFEFNEFN